MTFVSFSCASFQSKFAIPTRGVKWTMSSLGKKWREYKSDLKGTYFDGKDIAEAFRNPPDGIIRYQWEFLVSFWNSEKGKVVLFILACT